LISNKEGLAQIDVMLFCRPIDQCWLRLSAIALVIGVMRAIVNGIDVSLILGQIPSQLAVDSAQHCPGKIATGDSRLIGDHDHFAPSFVKYPYSIAHRGQ